MIAFRVTRSFSELEAFITKLSHSSTRLLVYEHESSRIHIHGLITDCTVSTDTLKNWIKNVLDCKQFPKSDWSFITQDKKGRDVDDNFIIYMSKGVLQPRFVHGYTDDEIEQYRLQWKPPVKVKTQYVIKLEKPAEAKKRQIDMIDEIVRRVDSERLVVTEDIVKVICDVVYRENHTIVGRYKIRDYYDMVMYRSQPDAFIRQMSNLCLKV